jgi:hypothetical protein
MNSDDEVSLYHQIATYMVQALPNSWQEAWIDFEFEPNVITASGQYLPEIDNQHQTFVVDRAINHLMNQLREYAAEKSHDTWKAVRFRLHPNGQFKLNITYVNR